MTLISLTIIITNQFLVEPKKAIIEQKEVEIDRLRQEKYDLLQMKENYGRHTTEYALEIDKLKNKFEIDITSPKEGDKVSNFSVVRGTINGEMPKGQFMWIVSNIESVPGLWWP